LGPEKPLKFGDSPKIRILLLCTCCNQTLILIVLVYIFEQMNCTRRRSQRQSWWCHNYVI